LLLQPCNQQGHFSFSVAVLPLFRLSSKIFRIFRQEAKNTRVPTLGYSGATHNTALLGGRRVRGFVDIEPIVRPWCIFHGRSSYNLYGLYLYASVRRIEVN
jgi:hypothetical protein